MTRALTSPSGRAVVADGHGRSIASPAPPLMEAPHPSTRGVILLGLMAMAVFIGGFSVWSVSAPLAEAAIANGLIEVEGQRRVIANQEGGSVQELLVREGDHVLAGQVLMRLNDVQASATAETARAERWALLAKLARLDAETAGRSDISFPDDLLAAASGQGFDAQRAADVVSGQRALFEARTVSLKSQVAVLRDRVDQQLGVIESAEQQQRATRQQLELIRHEAEIKQGLLTKGLATLSVVLALQRNQAGLEGTLGDLSGQIQRARATIAESRSSMQQIQDQRLQDVSNDIREARIRLNEVDDKLRAAQDVAVRRDVVAPEDGTVLGMRVFNNGAVVKPGDTVMELLPSRDRLVANVKLSPNDIDVVYPGLEAQVRLPAFKQRLVPFVAGRVTFVASDVTADEQTKSNYYKVQILIDQDQLVHLPNVRLTPGMPVEAMVQLGERSFFRYITQPVRDSFHRAFHEQ
ncbi:HlyD family type I secretion periplasmic adaptor subunit [Bradyrhizobium sp. Leo121]|uniref:HlyD family type I secretion periplasmic adaptor subunit n=1 Tax=Bradyrhizobium sp. Leo121 TaxID=1571195 RepID=UPI00102941D9|nr:HlyD family type I secretion periplasmic adaptor subunit [Bradyrhizobium sp. Leo121]RZN31266.1 HlyD family type I secretion periplasmic adaptor subunit [Bradyrhizobium sp. Leo121]